MSFFYMFCFALSSKVISESAVGPILSNHLFGILLDYFIDTPYIVLSVVAGAGVLVAIITNIKKEK